jgi:hypothetical protein
MYQQPTNLAFGPVPSRKLEQSLGINNITVEYLIGYEGNTTGTNSL